MKLQSGKTETRVVVVLYCIIKIVLTFHVGLTWNTQVESMWLELKTKLSPLLININYRSERDFSYTLLAVFRINDSKGLG